MSQEQKMQENVIQLVRGTGRQQQKAERTLDRSQLPIQALTQEQAQLRARIQDLQRDWLPRNPDFWNAMLDSLHWLRNILEVFHDQLEDYASQRRLNEHVSTRLMVDAHDTNTLSDEAGIAITAYLPHTASQDKRYLRQRHEALLTLQQLSSTVQGILDQLPQEKNRHE